MDDRFWKWLSFGVALALLPIAFNLLYALTVTGVKLTLALFFGRGELLLIAVGLCAGALGDLILMQHRWKALKMVTTVVCIADIAFASFYFAIVSGDYALQRQTDSEVVVVISLVLYAVPVVSGGTSVVSAER